MLSKIKEALEHGLFLHMLETKLKRFGIRLTIFYLVTEGDFASPPEWPDQYADYEPFILSREDMETIAPDHPWDDLAGLRSRHDRGHICVGLRHGDQIAACTWVDLEQCNHAPLPFKMSDNEAYLYDAFTLPSFRGKGLAPYMREQCYEQLRAMSRDKFYSVSSYLNKPSVRFKQKLNARFEELFVSVATKTGKLHTVKLKSY
ncbi:MAG: GNAT family N-acetyltransferase [Halioglobus sp.]